MQSLPPTMTLEALKEMAMKGFGDMVKAVADLEKGIIVIDAELHADLESALLAQGSQQADLWGFNVYPDLDETEWIEFSSMINIRPSGGNTSRNVEDPQLQAKIKSLASSLITR